MWLLLVQCLLALHSVSGQCASQAVDPTVDISSANEGIFNFPESVVLVQEEGTDWAFAVYGSAARVAQIQLVFNSVNSTSFELTVLDASLNGSKVSAATSLRPTLPVVLVLLVGILALWSSHKNSYGAVFLIAILSLLAFAPLSDSNASIDCQKGTVVVTMPSYVNVSVNWFQQNPRSFVSSTTYTPPAGSLIVYGDALATGWTDSWSWSSTRNFVYTTTVHSGADSLQFSSSNWGGLQLANPNSAISTSTYQGIAFWVYLTTSVPFLVNIISTSGATLGTATAGTTFAPGGTIPTNVWVQLTIPFSTFTSASTVGGLWLQVEDSAATVILLDDIIVYPTTCTPSCGGITCGTTDGCGGSCACFSPKVCSAGSCVTSAASSSSSSFSSAKSSSSSLAKSSSSSSATKSSSSSTSSSLPHSSSPVPSSSPVQSSSAPHSSSPLLSSSFLHSSSPVQSSSPPHSSSPVPSSSPLPSSSSPHSSSPVQSSSGVASSSSTAGNPYSTCAAAPGYSVTLGASTTTVAFVNPPSNIPSCGTFTVTVSFSAATTTTQVLVLDTDQSVSPYAWYGGGNCTIQPGATGTVTITVTISQGPVPLNDNTHLSVWIVDAATYISDPSTAYLSAEGPGQIYSDVTVVQTTCACVASCSGKTCGSDGCSGSCGTCASGFSCTSSQTCAVPCVSGTSWSNSGYAPCTTCSATPSCSATQHVVACTATNDVSCQVNGYPRLKGINLSGAEWGSVNWPTTAEIDYYLSSSVGMNIIRFPVLWERLLDTVTSTSFDTSYFNPMNTLINYITQTKGGYVLLDIHNYARYPYNGAVIGSGTTAANLANLWGLLATQYKSNPNVVFGLMNEPNGLDATVWIAAANAAIAAIRQAGATNIITVPGVQWTGGWSWSATYYGTPNSVGLEKPAIVDSLNRFVIEIHQYMDSGYSGTSNDCVSSPTLDSLLSPFTSWARSNGYRAFVGEFAGGTGSNCQTQVASFLNHIQANEDVYVGYTWWASGPGWDPPSSSYMYDLGTSTGTPSGTPATQLAWLLPYLPPAVGSGDTTWNFP